MLVGSRIFHLILLHSYILLHIIIIIHQVVIGISIIYSLQQAFSHIDYEIPLRLIKLAKEAGVHHCSLLTSTGANPNSWFLYLKTKGRMEESTKEEKFDYTSIFQPGALNRGSGNQRLAEKLSSKFLSSRITCFVFSI